MNHRVPKSRGTDAPTGPPATPAEPQPPGCVDQMFRRQVQQRPNAVALCYRDQRWTYAQLDRRAERLAGRLRSLGVGPDVLAGICLERSPEMVMAVLAVLKAGGAYLPLDASYPRQRLALMLDDAQAPVVLTQTSLLDRLPKWGGQIVCLDVLPPPSGAAGNQSIQIDTPRRTDAARDARPERIEAPSAHAVRPVRPNDLAYAIFTSGSTGRPKAVLIEHRGLARLCLAQRQAFGITPRSRVLQFASLSFDASVSEIFVTLTSGATLCLAAARQLHPGTELLGTLRGMRISVATIPPSVLLLLGATDLPHLKTLVVAGESCPAELASRWSVGRRLINAYGPTEATVCATWYECPQGPQPAPPIGQPFPYCHLLVVDEQLQPVAAGAPGELLIGGPGVARGYLNRPDLTAARFLSLSRPHDASTRCYRTGDRVRCLPDGNLVFLGRMDHQVKVRGVRIELDEIAATLEAHADIARAVVQHDESAGRLVAFAARRKGRQPTADQLRKTLKQTLPAYMIPSAITVIDRMPLTANGKIDRAALPAAPAVSARGSRAVEAPRDGLELELVHLWQELLDHRPVGIRDDFFDLGGDSLRAMELLVQLERRWGCRLSPSVLLAGPTIETLAGALRHRPTNHPWSPLVPIQPRGSKRPFFCVHPGGGSGLCYLDLACHLDDQQPFFALQAPGIDGVRDPLKSVADMAAEYVAAIRQVQPTGPYLVGGWSFGGIIAYEMARLLEEQHDRVGLLAILDAGILYAFAVMRTIFPDDSVPLFRMGAVDRTQHLDYFRRCGLEAQIIPPGAGDGLTKRILDIFLLNAEATYDYRPRPFGGRADLLLAAERFTRVRIRRDPFQEWSELCGGGVEKHTVPGNHLTMIRQPHVRALGRCLQTCLDRATRGENGHLVHGAAMTAEKPIDHRLTHSPARPEAR